MQKWVTKLPLGKWLYRRYVSRKVKREFKDTVSWWEKRYAGGGNSGAGSRGRLAEFKILTVNQLIAELGISSVTDLGCGDGFIASRLQGVRYTGMDVSETAIRHCRTLCSNLPSHAFIVYHPGKSPVPHADLALSQDVIYHQVEDELFSRYMNDLFDAGRKYVLIYSSDFEEAPFGWMRHRRFTDWVKERRSQFVLERILPNAYPFDGKDYETTSQAQYYLYRKTS